MKFVRPPIPFFLALKNYQMKLELQKQHSNENTFGRFITFLVPIKQSKLFCDKWHAV